MLLLLLSMGVGVGVGLYGILTRELGKVVYQSSTACLENDDRFRKRRSIRVLAPPLLATVRCCLLYIVYIVHDMILNRLWLS